MKVATALPLLAGLVVVGLMARPMMDFGEERAAAGRRSQEMTDLLQRATVAAPAPFVEQLRGAVNTETPSDEELAKVRELVRQAEEAKAQEAPK